MTTTWPTALALFTIGYALPLLWRYTRQLADVLAPRYGGQDR